MGKTSQFMHSLPGKKGHVQSWALQQQYPRLYLTIFCGNTIDDCFVVDATSF